MEYGFYGSPLVGRCGTKQRVKSSAPHAREGEAYAEYRHDVLAASSTSGSSWRTRGCSIISGRSIREGMVSFNCVCRTILNKHMNYGPAQHDARDSSLPLSTCHRSTSAYSLTAGHSCQHFHPHAQFSPLHWLQHRTCSPQASRLSLCSA